MKDIGKHYVYTLTDPRSGEIFYVGKGQGRRMYMHERLARLGRPAGNYEKFLRIQSILRDHQRPTLEIVICYDNALDAYDHERQLISKIGLENLTNIRPGGGGEVAHSSEAIMAKYQVREARRIEKFRSWLSRIDQWPCITIPGIANGEEKAREFVNIVRGIVASFDAEQRLLHSEP